LIHFYKRIIDNENRIVDLNKTKTGS